MERYIDHSEYFGDYAVFPKETLISFCFDGRLAGSSSVQYAYDRTSACKLELTHMSEEKASGCRKVLALNQQILTCKHELNECKKSGEDITALSIRHEKLQQEYNALVQTHCKGCANRSQILHTTDTKRVNYARFSTGKLLPLSVIKVYIAVCYITATSGLSKEELEDDDSVTCPIQVSIRLLSQLCDMNNKTVKTALRTLQKMGHIIYTHIDFGVYSVKLTLEEERKKYRPAAKGGAGFLMLPSAAVQYLLQIDQVDALRLALLMLLDHDHAAYSGQYKYKKNQQSILTNFSLLRFLLRPQNRSLSQILDRLKGFNRLLTDECIIIAPCPSKTNIINQTHYDSYSLSIPVSIAPVQYDYTADVTLATVTQPELRRRLSDDAEKEVRRAMKFICGANFGYGGRGHAAKADAVAGLFPTREIIKLFGHTAAGREILKNDTLMPALTTIANRYGRRYLYDSIVATVRHFKDRMATIAGKSKSDEYKDALADFSSYMIAIARTIRNGFLRSWRHLDQDINRIVFS